MRVAFGENKASVPAHLSPRAGDSGLVERLVSASSESWDATSVSFVLWLEVMVEVESRLEYARPPA